VRATCRPGPWQPRPSLPATRKPNAKPHSSLLRGCSFELCPALDERTNRDGKHEAWAGETLKWAELPIAVADKAADTPRAMTFLIALGAYLVAFALFVLWWARLPQ
jgi:hypothetical protein